MFKFILILIFFSSTIYGQSYKEQFSLQLTKLKHLESKDYSEKILKIKQKINSLFDKKRGVCIGEFSPSIFDTSQMPTSQSTPVQNKNGCFLELKQNQLTYFKTLYLQRKRFFSYSHKMQLKKLEDDFFKLNTSLLKEVDALKKKTGRR